MADLAHPQHQSQVQTALQQQQRLQLLTLKNPPNSRVFVIAETLEQILKGCGFEAIIQESGERAARPTAPLEGRPVSIARGERVVVLTARPPDGFLRGGVGVSFLFQPLPQGMPNQCLIGQFRDHGNGPMEVEPCYIPISSEPFDLAAGLPKEVLNELIAAFRTTP